MSAMSFLAAMTGQYYTGNVCNVCSICDVGSVPLGGCVKVVEEWRGSALSALSVVSVWVGN